MGKSKKMHVTTPVLAQVFKALERADMIALSQCKEEEIRPILPCLVRMSLIAPIENTLESTAARKAILKILSGIETVNAMVALLSVDFVTLESDFKKEQQLRQKVGGLGCGGPQDGSVLVQNLINGLALEFECSEPLKRLRLLLSEIIFVMAQLKEPRGCLDWYHKECELFDNQCYFEEVADILSIGVSELPGLLSPGELAETLLHFSNAPHLISRIVANQPDYFKEVVSSLILNGEVQDEDTEGGLVRLRTVRTLCLMNPALALHARHLCVENCRMPGLAIYLTLDAAKSAAYSHHSALSLPCITSDADVGGATEIGDVVSFVTGLLLSPDQQQRAWFSLYVKNAQKRKWDHPWSGLSALRTELSERLCALLLFRTTHLLPASQVIPATALLRLYTALKNLPAIKLHDEKEVGPLLQLLTCEPPMSAAGVRFVSTGVCVLIACPQLLGTPEHERRAADWIKWLLKEEVHFSGALGVWSSSFGALLLLVAIHFHVGQLSAILELVSAALGMKVVTRPNNLTKIRHIITQEVFTESVVTLIASKVSVTRGLNASLPGFLPVHCVYHLLRSRMFTRHKVNIKNWIYRQICSSRPPMHSVLPQLVEVFVRSVLGVAAAPTANTNDPITEQQILAVFQLSSFAGGKGKRHVTSRSSRHGSHTRTRPRLRNTTAHCVFFKSTQTNNSISSSSSSSSTGVDAMMVDDDGDALIGGRLSASADAGQTAGPLEVSCVMTSQLLLLYYLLLYEDLRLTTITTPPHHQPSPPPPPQQQQQQYVYSASLFSQLPIRYLLSRAQKDQAMYGGLFSALLKLLAQRYPQLCLVEDWLYSPPHAPPSLSTPRTPLTPAAIAQAMVECLHWPGLLVVLLERCLQLPSSALWSTAAAPLTNNIRHLLGAGVPRTVLDKYVLVWRRLNSIYPRRLWAMTVEGLREQSHTTVAAFAPPSRRPLTEDDLVLDPLYVLRCDQRVFRRAPILQLVEYILRVYLLSSRTFLQQHQQSTAPAAAVGAAAAGMTTCLEEERDKLRCALLLTQESAAVQILLESTLLDHKEKACSSLCLQEVQSVVFSYLHQAFIRDTTLAKLVHFQGYPRELIGPVVQGVPSMHIAVGLNWIPELLQLPHLQQLHRQHQSLHQLLFTLELMARLALQNAMPSTMSIARLALNVLSTLISVLSSEGRLLLVRGSVTSLVVLGRVFPALLPDLTQLLVTCARLTRAHAAILPAPAPGVTGNFDCEAEEDDPMRGNSSCVSSSLSGGCEAMDCDEPLKDIKCQADTEADGGRKQKKHLDKFPLEDQMLLQVTKAFRKLVEEATMSLKIY